MLRIYFECHVQKAQFIQHALFQLLHKQLLYNAKLLLSCPFLVLNVEICI